MNIYALPGFKVKVTEESLRNGYQFDKDKVASLCEIGKEYTVTHTHVGNSSTVVYLEEFPGVRFNSVNFEDVEPQSEELDEGHDDWEYYN